MTDRLEEIKKLRARPENVQFEKALLDDIDWLISEVERLRKQCNLRDEEIHRLSDLAESAGLDAFP